MRVLENGKCFWLRKIATNFHSLAHANVECPDDRNPELYILYLRNDFRYPRIHTSTIRNNALHDLTLIKMTVVRFVGTGGFLIRYSNGHTS
jgi:hypothetical protein